MNKKQKLQELLAAKRAELQKLFDGSETAENATTHLGLIDGVQGEITNAENEIKAIEQLEARTRAAVGNRRPGQVRENLLDKPFANFGEQLLAVVAAAHRPAETDPRLYELTAAGSNEASPADGGFLVQQDISTEIFRIAHDQSEIAKRCRVIPIGPSANGLKMPMVKETSRATGSRWGGVRVSRANEAASANTSKPQVDRLEISLEKLMGFWEVTDELLEDATAMSGIAVQAFGEEFAWVLDDECIFGDGQGKCLGIINSPAKVVVAKEVGQGADTVVTENINKMWNRCPSWARSNAAWFINLDAEPQLETMYMATGANSGVPVYLPPGGLTEAPFGRLKGRPVIPIEQAAGLGDLGDIFIADWAYYLLITKGGLKQDQSMHVRFMTGENTFRFTRRVSGQPLMKAPIAAAKGGTTRSPFVFLEAR